MKTYRARKEALEILLEEDKPGIIVMRVSGPSGQAVVMVADRSGIHRAHKLDATLEHYQGKLRLQLLPAHCGHPLNPIAGFWRAMQDVIGAGRCLSGLQ